MIAQAKVNDLDVHVTVKQQVLDLQVSGKDEVILMNRFVILVGWLVDLLFWLVGWLICY